MTFLVTALALGAVGMLGSKQGVVEGHTDRLRHEVCYAAV
jgi:hypothetical protein